jgi:hypothetical protein
MLTRISSQGILGLLTVLLVAGVCSAKPPAVRAPQTPGKPAVAPEAIAALMLLAAYVVASAVVSIPYLQWRRRQACGQEPIAGGA